ncbi:MULTISPECIES: hypothetical protein [Enterobacterales]|uniref:hypothetical protein n=1 Tax=Enterobacterales TaxID=91347 RepID=UPI000BBD2A43|nr:hypothetical protein [Morganella morganii]ATF53846.1 hypothetical protein CO693_09070 [Morganella morganii]MDN3814917.1 hypothetical protein [Morganella morganii]MEA1624708.1 hypothetical protein [Salmonella enterica]
MYSKIMWTSSAVSVFICVTLAIFFYWNIDDGSKWSTFFGFTSTFGITATIWVYFRQLSTKKEDEKRELESHIMVYSNEFNDNTINIMNRIDAEIERLENIYGLDFGINNFDFMNILKELGDKNKIIEINIPSVRGYSERIDFSIIRNGDPALFEQITLESSFIDEIIRVIDELKFEIGVKKKPNNFYIYGYIQDIYLANNSLRKLIEGNYFL